MLESPHSPEAENLTDRDLRILGAIIDDYIVSPEPVGSRTLARSHGLEVSPATVRNVMSDLEELGYLTKPHASAGRVPTSKAFRLYVDSFLRVQPLRQRERAKVDRSYDPPADEMTSLMQQTGRVLHQLTHHAALVAAPKLSQTVLGHISFVRLRDNRVLAVMVTKAGVVQNRPLTVDFPVSQDDLDKMSRYLEHQLEKSGGSLGRVRAHLAKAVEKERASYDEMVGRALDLGQRAISGLEAPSEQDLVIEGEASFLDAPEFADRAKIRKLLASLSEKETILRILERAEDSPGIRIFIGSDSELVGGEDVSLVLATYRGDGTILGTLGVIGPTRMNYSRIIPYVEYTAELLARIVAGEHA